MLKKSITGMRSFVIEPMRYGRLRAAASKRTFVIEPMRHGWLLLAGDAAHIVPPTGAKGMNLAIADIRQLSAALTAQLNRGRGELVAGHSEACLRRVWRAEHFCWWMTSMLHRFDGPVFPTATAVAVALYNVVVGHNVVVGRGNQSSKLAFRLRPDGDEAVLAENYVGLPYD